MTSGQRLRELINERLTAAAEEIFRHFQTTISEYEEEINRQRRLLDIVWKPEVKLHRTELQQQHVCKEEEEEVLTDQQLCDQERNSTLDQEEPEPPQIKEGQEEPEPPQIKEEEEEPEFPQIKEEQEELCASLGAYQLVLKEETETLMWTPTCEESEDQTLDLSPDETQIAAEEEQFVSMSVKSSVKPEPDSDDQLLSHNSYLAENQNHKASEPKPQKRHHTNNEDKCTSLNIHSNTFTGKQCFKCDTCGKSFACKSNWRRHQRVHTGEKPYPCNTCEKRFSQPGALKAHLRVHTGEKPYPCNTCEKRFSEPNKLKLHMRTHTGEKPYACNTCEKRFSQPGALNLHIRTHTGEKPYPCNTCDKSFPHLGTLNLHIRTHTGEKPYPCNTCGKSFPHLGTLKHHMRIHTGEKPYTCKTCGREFRLGHNLKIHMRTHAVGKDSV